MPCDNVPRCLKECAVCRLTGPFLVFVLLRQEANWLREIEVEALQKYSITTPCQQSSSLGAGREERNRRKREALCPPQAALGLEGLAFWRLWRGLPERAQGFAGRVFAPKVSWGACGKGRLTRTAKEAPGCPECLFCMICYPLGLACSCLVRSTIFSDQLVGVFSISGMILSRYLKISSGEVPNFFRQ